MAAEAVLHNALEGAPGNALQQAVIPFLFGSLGAQHGRNQRLQGFPARKGMLCFRSIALSTLPKGREKGFGRRSDRHAYLSGLTGSPSMLHKQGLTTDRDSRLTGTMRLPTAVECKAPQQDASQYSQYGGR